MRSCTRRLFTASKRITRSVRLHNAASYRSWKWILSNCRTSLRSSTPPSWRRRVGRKGPRSSRLYPQTSLSVFEDAVSPADQPHPYLSSPKTPLGKTSSCKPRSDSAIHCFLFSPSYLGAVRYTEASTSYWTSCSCHGIATLNQQWSYNKFDKGRDLNCHTHSQFEHLPERIC